MANIVKDIAQLVGHTPLYEFARYGKKHELKATVLGKLEYFNPSGSIKDRTALNMILDAEEKGLLKPGDTIVEDTSGNTGIGLAAFAANRGYKLKIFLEADQSIERRKIIKAYGVDVKFTTDVPGLKEAKETGTFSLKLYQELIEDYCKKQDSRHFYTNQLSNESNPSVHYKYTGPEIWEDTDGKVDILVATAGTGGTITGLARYLREKNPHVKIVAVQADINSRTGAGEHPKTIDGIAPFAGDDVEEECKAPFMAGFDYDEYIDVSGADAYATGLEIARTEGILLGQSASAAMHAARQVAARDENAGKNIVVILADNGMKYLSTQMYD